MKIRAGWMCLLALLGRPTLAAGPAMVEREVWLCKGVTQSAPGEPLQPEARHLEFDFTSDDLLMSVDTTQYRTRFQASTRHYEAMLNLTLEGGVQATESLHLVRANGQITATTPAADGRQMRLFRSNCHPEGVPEK